MSDDVTRDLPGWLSEALAASLEPVPPPPFVRARILASAEPRGHLAAHADALARFFEIGLEKARALLEAIATDDAWEPHPSGLRIVHVAGGPRLAAAHTTLARFPAGAQWPLHRHTGEERHLFLAGGIREHVTGRTFHAGDLLVSAPGTEHAFDVLPGEDCVTAVILTAGVEMPPGTPVAL